MYRVPDSSTPPSTPASRRSAANNPSTTPAGPPPTALTGASFTPAGPPPSSAFGSSQLHTGYTAASRGRAQRGPPQGLFDAASSYRVPGSSPPLLPAATPGQDYSDDESDELGPASDREGSDVSMDNGSEMSDASGGEDEQGYNLPDGLMNSYGALAESSGPSRGIKRFRNGASLNNSMFESRGAGSLQSTKDSAMASIARGLASAAKPAALHEPDDLILSTERIMSQTYNILNSEDAIDVAVPIAAAVQELTALLRNHPDVQNNATTGIGPGDQASPVSKANFLVSLLLELHYPAQSIHEPRLSSTSRGRLSASLQSQHVKQKPIPRVLVDWMATYHDPDKGLMKGVRNHKPASTAHPDFWETVIGLVFHGRIGDATNLLETADFRYAHTAIDDGHNDIGYSGKRLGNIQLAIGSAVHLLRDCPIVRSDDWDVKGADWSLFRHRIGQAMTELRDFAEGARQDDEGSDPFEAENFGISDSGAHPMSISRASRKAESRVPWTIYENLLQLFNLLIGDPDTLIKCAIDWVDAVIGLTVWWDGEDEDMPKGSLALSRRSLMRSQHIRAADVTPALAYRRKLATSFARIFEDDDAELAVNTANPVEVGLASIFEGNVENAVGIIRGWSMTVAAAVIELASAGNWLKNDHSKARDVMRNLDQSDLMVLSYGQVPQEGIDKDGVLVHYAELLQGRHTLRMPNAKASQEGWEIAIQVLSRLDHAENAGLRIGELLDRLSLKSAERVDKILALCHNLDLSEHASRTAERYADSLAENTYEYGTALLYYARAHNSKKMKDVLDLLVSLCLVQSMAYPPESDLDARLKEFILSPKETLTQLARIDHEAARLLSTYLSGYATLRRFYDLRDEGLNVRETEKPRRRPLTRKKEAASTLMAVINSASDCIRGGLFDPTVDVVIQVDGLLALLGEVLPFINQSYRFFSTTEIFDLSRVIEDLQTVASRVYAQCEECLQSAIANVHGAEAPSPRAMLKKSMSAMTASTQFSLVGSSMLGSQPSDSIESSGVLVSAKIRRGWDWRKGLPKETSGADILRILRLGLAKDMARSWAEGNE